jgi:hypothetical protein
MESRITPQEKSKPINEAKDDYFNEVIKLRSEYISKKLENTVTLFDYTNLLRALLGLVTHTSYYLPDTKIYGTKPLKKAITEFVSQNATMLMKLSSIDEGLKISEAYIIALQEESICSYK